MLFSRTHFFIFTLALTAAYGFYIITTDDDDYLRYPGSNGYGNDALPLSANGFVPQVGIPEGVMVFDDDDGDYMDRVDRLQHALRTKRDVIALADAYSQNIRPIDLDGIRLVRKPVIEYDDTDTDEYDEIPARRSKRSFPVDSDDSISFIVFE